MALKFEYFPDELVELNIEVGNHPDLGERLNRQPDKDVYIQLAEIAAFCNVVLDDTYTHKDILELCKLLKDILYKRRTGITIIH